MTLSWAIQVATDPKLRGSVGRGHGGHPRADRSRGDIRDQHIEARGPDGGRKFVKPVDPRRWTWTRQGQAR